MNPYIAKLREEKEPRKRREIGKKLQ